MATLTIYPGDVKLATPSVTGSDSAAAGPAGYDLSFSNDSPTTIQIVVNNAGANAQTATVTGLAAGTAHVTWTVKPKGKYSGSPATQVDTITVSGGRTLTGLAVAYT
jgi:hypothetical protein